MAHPPQPELASAAANHTFRCVTEIINNATRFHLRVGETGIIKEVRSAGKFAVVILSARVNAPEVVVPTYILNHNTQGWEPVLKVGKKYGTWKIIHGRPRVQKITGSFNSESRSNSNTYPFNICLQPLLSGISENLHQLPITNDTLVKPLKSPDDVRQTLDKITDYLRQASKHGKDLTQVLMSTQDLTIEKILETCPEITANNHRAGVYLIVYSNFKEGSKYYGHKPYIYVGHTIDFSKRKARHRKAAEDSADQADRNHYNGHYQVAREATGMRMVQLAVTPLLVNNSQEDGRALRRLIEQVMILWFDTYTERARSWEVRLSEQALNLAIADQVTNKSLCTLFTDLAKAAFAKSGYQQRTHSQLGVQGGLNTTSPFGGETINPYDKILYTRQELRDRWVFHRSALVLTKGKRGHGQIFSIGERFTEGGAQFAVVIQDEDIHDCPQPGETYYPIWEIMKDIPHDVPYFRTQDISPWSNGRDVQKMAFKVIWKKKDGTWRVRYFQSAAEFYTVDKYSQAAEMRYATGSGLYSYFMRASYPEAPKWMPRYGFAEQIIVDVDGFNQEVRVRHETGALRKLVGPKFNENVAAKQMNELIAGDGTKVVKVFDNVCGARDSLDNSWVDNDPDINDKGQGAMTVTNWKKFARKRFRCDRCFMGASIRSGNNSFQCEQYPNSDRCQPCVQQGLPCSWTHSKKIGGRRFFEKDQELSPEKGNLIRAFSGSVFQAARRAILYYPKIAEANTSIALPIDHELEVLTAERVEEDWVDDLEEDEG